MNYHQNNYVKYAIFFLGLLIIAFAPLVLNLKFIEFWKVIFTDITALSLYTLFFYPFLLNFNDKNGSGSIFTAGGIYYRGVYVYAVLSLVIIYAVFGMNLKMTAAILLQFAAVFVFFVYIYLSNVTADHIEHVKNIEDEKTTNKHYLRAKIQELAIDTEDISNEEIKKLINEINEDIRYLSPTENLDGLKIEESIVALVDELSGRKQLSEEAYLKTLKQIKTLLKKRKTIM